MPRPFDPRQQAENRRFLEILGETGNARLAAREVGRKPSTMHYRRSVCAAFAQRWEAAAAAAHARFFLGGGARLAGAGEVSSTAVHSAPPPRFARSPSPSKLGEELRTAGGEAVVVRVRKGTLQLRFAHRGKLTATAEQVFLAALSATANVRLSAAAAGASPGAFYRRRRRDAAFAREYRLALKMGYDRLECAMLEAASTDSGDYDGWRHNDPPEMPPLTPEQALQQLCHHRKGAEMAWDPPYLKRRRGESPALYSERLRAVWTLKEAQGAEDGALARAAARAIAWETRARWRLEDEPAPLPVPPLHLVTGWSKASGKAPHHPELSLFGGWRIGDMRKKMRERGASRE